MVAVAFPPPYVLDAEDLAYVLARSDEMLAYAVAPDAAVFAHSSPPVGAVTAFGVSTRLAERVIAALSLSEHATARRLIDKRGPITTKEIAARKSISWQDRAIKRCAAYVRERLQTGDHQQRRGRLAAPIPVPSVAEILSAAAHAGRVTSITIAADSAADAQDRAEQLRAAGCKVGALLTYGSDEIGHWSAIPVTHDDGAVCSLINIAWGR